MGIRHDIHHGAVAALLRSSSGGVARDMLRRGVRVQAQARRNLAGGNGKPRRIDTGALRSSIYVVPIRVDGMPGARVGTGMRYARWVHDGTGIHGPRRRPITPNGQFLRFTPKGWTTFVFARSVKGMRANPFLADALSAARY